MSQRAPKINDRVIWLPQPESQGRVIEIRTRPHTSHPEVRPEGITEVQIEWDDGFDDSNSPWWTWGDFHIAGTPR